MQELLDDIAAAEFLVAHHSKFEAQWLSRCGLDLHDLLVWDTMLGEWVTHGNVKVPFNLEATAQRHGIGGKLPMAALCLKMGIPTEDIPVSWLEPYCFQDVDLATQLYYKQMQIMEEKGLLHLMLVRCLTSTALADIEMAGCELDAERVNEEYERLTTELARLESELSIMAGGINLGSSKQLGEFLFDKLNFAIPKDFKGKPMLTAKGAYKTDKATISKLNARTAEQKKFLEAYVTYNQYSALLTKNVQFFKGVVDEYDSKFYGVFNQAVTGTHRLSSSGRKLLFTGSKKPSAAQLQNMPRQYKGMFTAHDPDYLVGESDGCFTAGHRILMSDLSWKNVEDVIVGDELLGLEEHVRSSDSYRGYDRRMLRSTVEAARTREVECIRLDLGDGTSVTVSEEHPFLVRDSHRGAYRWETAAWILSCPRKVYIRKLVDVEEDMAPRAWGKMAAYIDGEGSVGHDKIQLTQQAGTDIAQDMRDLCDELDLPYRVYNFRMSELSTKPVCSVTITGMKNLIKIQQLAKPVKLARTPTLLWEGKCPKGHNVLVVGGQRVGVQTVYSIQTSTKTYVGEGLFSHNCQLEFRVAADLGHDEVALAEIIEGADIHSFTAKVMIDAGHPDFKGLTVKEGRQKAKAHTFAPLKH